ncbi:MAG: D-tyrosyl-tRNA(Tyr) deacylase [Rhodocyclaceae bacterium]|nr:D-tyrosyl-tRNA(Tyr) deacylase [Rhodocyclaceae bacterium]
MIALIQRVTEARVVVEGETVGAIGPGLLALIGIEREDAEANATRMIERLLGYRVFQDDADRMNRSLRDVAGGLLLVPQFTLAADTRKGTRPGFSTAAEPARANALFEHLLGLARAAHDPVESGRFGAEMFISLTNHGPVTFRLEA